MKTPLAALLVLFSALALSACGTTQTAQQEIMTPLPADPIDPTDTALRESVTEFLTASGAPVSSAYDFRRVDLDNDGRRDALVIFKNPYGYWCDLHGCTMLVMKADDKKFELVNAIQPVREPLYISNAETNGWKNLIIRVTGRWNESKDVAIMFDGNHYPDNPATLPAYMRLASGNETRLFY